MQDQFGALLRGLVIPAGVLPWLPEAVAESDLNERGARDRELKRLEEQHRRVQAKLETIYEDRLECRISKELYDRKSHDLRTQSLEILNRMNEMQRTSTPRRQRFLKLVLKSATWQDGRLCTEFEKSF